MLHFWIVGLFFLNNVFGDSCKLTTMGAYIYPLDFCTNYKTAGNPFSSKYTCQNNDTQVVLTIYTDDGCPDSSSKLFSTTVQNVNSSICDESLCNDVARVRTYATAECNTSTTFVDTLYVAGICVNQTSSFSWKYNCDDGNLTRRTYGTGDCSGNETVINVAYDGDCDSLSYITVDCDIDPDSSSASFIHLSLGIIILLVSIAFLV